MGDFWRAQDRPDLGQVWLIRTRDPARIASGDGILYLETDPTGLDASGRVAKIDYGSAPPPMVFTTNLPTTAPDVYLSNGETFGPLNVAVTGGVPPYSYQWKRGTANVGSNSPTFGPATVDSVFPSNGAFNWSCVVTDSAGTSITSNIMPVTAYRLPSFTTQPQSVSVAAGATISIPSAAASTSKAPRTYQWQKNNAGTWGNVSGQTSNTFTKSNAVAGDAGDYRVIVTDANGKTATSNTATVTIT